MEQQEAYLRSCLFKTILTQDQPLSGEDVRVYPSAVRRELGWSRAEPPGLVSGLLAPKAQE